jgi:arylsulfatase A-like enzyme
MPELLADAGYDTHLCGFQHVGDPERLGFQQHHSQNLVPKETVAAAADVFDDAGHDLRDIRDSTTPNAQRNLPVGWHSIKRQRVQRVRGTRPNVRGQNRIRLPDLFDNPHLREIRFTTRLQNGLFRNRESIDDCF